MSRHLRWKENWSETQKNLVKWWDGEGMALSLVAARSEPVEPVAKPPTPAGQEARWTDPIYRCSLAEYEMVHRHYHAESFPYFDTQIGPGSLGLFLGAEPLFDARTVWYEPCLDDPDSFGAIHFTPENNRWWDVHLALVNEGIKRANDRYLVGVPDLIENIDTLAAMRGEMKLLYDLTDRPAWVHARLAEITEAWFAAFDLIFDRVSDEDGGNAFAAFQIWGPGKTAKIQCDFSAMISPAMFREFVLPHLTTQCRWLDYAMYHLDGTNALQHLDILLEMEDLQAIEWTPQAGRPQGGSPEWYDLYRRIKSAGKAVQAIEVQVEEVIPLLDAVGPEGLFMLISGPVPEADAEKLMKAVEPYRA
jgi:hypothetical protein